MSRRLLLTLLIPAMIGTMVGVGAAAFKPQQRVTAQAEDPSIEPAPAAEASEAAFELAFSTQPSGIRETELARAKRKPKTDTTPDFDVAEVQQRLTELRYYVGPVDGELGGATVSALMAFQKVQGIAADGAVGPQTLKALDDPASPSLKGGPGSRIEVDLTRQVLYYVSGGELERILPVSSGSGASYTTSSGGTARSLTPVGTYAIQRKISGLREADLGSLYDPMYFYQGWAIHGSNSVPAYPASHGCIRVTRSDALWLFPKAPVGFPVIIYGGTHTFTAGSSAPGTSNPAGDTDAAQQEQEAPPDESTPAPKPRAEPKSEPQPEPEPSKSPKPKPSEPEPAPTAAPTPSPSPTATQEQLPEPGD